jgi:hypothetical protein
MERLRYGERERREGRGGGGGHPQDASRYRTPPPAIANVCTHKKVHRIHEQHTKKKNNTKNDEQHRKTKVHRIHEQHNASTKVRCLMCVCLVCV